MTDTPTPSGNPEDRLSAPLNITVVADVDEAMARKAEQDKAIRRAALGLPPLKPATTAASFEYNPDQPRDEKGRWSPGGGGGGGGTVTGSPGTTVMGTPAELVPPITEAEARGNARPVSAEEFQSLAQEGKQQMDGFAANASPITGLENNLDDVKANAYQQVQQSWGGATIDAHTGDTLESNADKYALSTKPAGVNSISIPEDASQEEFNSAVDQAVQSFRPQLENQNSYLGIFHDDENARIDLDPVTVVDNLHQVDTIGAYTHAIGGAYHFSDGNGYWPPYVGSTTAAGTLEAMADDRGKTVKWKGPGQWRSAAVAAQGTETKSPNADTDRPSKEPPNPGK